VDGGCGSQLGALLTGGGYLVFTRYQSLATRHGGWGPLLPTRYQLLVTRHGGCAALLLAVDLGPDGEHDVAEHKRIERDEGDVAAEVEGEHAADEEEEHAAGFLIHWFSQPSSSFGAASRQSFFDLPQGLDSPLRSCRARIATHSAIRNAAASTPKNGPKFTTPCRSPVKAAGYFHRPIIPVEIVAPTPAKPTASRSHPCPRAIA
jgi:hypothetical protein